MYSSTGPEDTSVQFFRARKPRKSKNKNSEQSTKNLDTKPKLVLLTAMSRLTPYAYDKKTPNFAQGLDFLRFWARFWDSRHFQVTIYTVFHEESESEVKKCQMLEPVGKK